MHITCTGTTSMWYRPRESRAGETQMAHTTSMWYALRKSRAGGPCTCEFSELPFREIAWSNFPLEALFERAVTPLSNKASGEKSDHAISLNSNSENSQMHGHVHPQLMLLRGLDSLGPERMLLCRLVMAQAVQPAQERKLQMHMPMHL